MVRAIRSGYKVMGEGHVLVSVRSVGGEDHMVFGHLILVEGDWGGLYSLGSR